MKISKSESSKKKITVKSSKSTDTKQPVKACDDIAIVELAPCKYEDAINLIGAAIESLAQVAKEDEIAKDSIANLGVVMLDLKGECN